MIEAAIAGNANFDLSPADLERPGPHYSVDTVRLIRTRYQVAREACYFIIGGDSLVDLPDWHQPERLVAQCLLAVVHRPGSQPDVDQLETVIPGLSQALVWVPSPMLDLSGTDIRQRVAAGRSIRYQVPEPVRRYIQEQDLYRS
jgi:nicotinate-nucleotide adenylyltransferase